MDIPSRRWAFPCEVLLPGTSGLSGAQGVFLTRILPITRNSGEDHEGRVTPGGFLQLKASFLSEKAQ